ncbi:hypothetical protein EC970246_4226 [Escherichia coli 97.0246]|nr:hypothetical protein EC970246_1549 [Escherichia coli 97.0246]EIG91305.1 hypothetical protein EC970246_0291 [Escherichia coli 97.0246]EIG94137.1 hypothetical protein EC970246_1535 [Escherichia coli 97.0246]EIG95248.1 hypothetical protein EC970246_4226 [Escherichia coli 97.0246]
MNNRSNDCSPSVHPLMGFLCCLLLFVFINSPGMNKKKRFVFHYKNYELL